jgi:uncharacterized protein YjbJ (UPF0337 family)
MMLAALPATPVRPPPDRGAIIMDKNRIKGTAKQVKGSIKEAAGKLTGNTSLELEGDAEQLAGKVQKEYGKAKDRLRDA